MTREVPRHVLGTGPSKLKVGFLLLLGSDTGWTGLHEISDWLFYPLRSGDCRVCTKGGRCEHEIE